MTTLRAPDAGSATFQPVRSKGGRPSSAPRPTWPYHGVQWGVVRREDCFDMHDTARHSGLIQHAFPLGRDWLAACGFRTPLQKAFDGVLRPLLAMPGVYNPRCRRCAEAVMPPVPQGPDAPAQSEREGWLGHRLAPPAAATIDGHPLRSMRPMRPAVAVPVGPAWPLADLDAKAMLDTRPAGPTVIPVARPGDRAQAGADVAGLAGASAGIDATTHAAAGRSASAVGAMRPSGGIMTAGPDGRRAFVVEDRAQRLGR